MTDDESEKDIAGMDVEELTDALSDTSVSSGSFDATGTTFDSAGIASAPASDAVAVIIENIPDVKSFRVEYHIATDDFDIGSGLSDLETYDTVTLSVTRTMTETILKRIENEIIKREKEGFDIDQLVLGEPQYEALVTFCADKYGEDPEDVLPVSDLIVVPGPQIHPVVSNRRMLMEYQAEKKATDE